MMKKLRAKQEFFYGGATRKVGDQFEAADPDANILVVLGKAEDDTQVVNDQSVKPSAPKLQTAAVKAEEPSSAEPMSTQNTELPTGRRRYARRDMVAKE